MIKCRTAPSHANISLQRGPARRGKGGKTNGYRVRINMKFGMRDGFLSVYPQDARKFAMELLAMADQCEKP